MTSTPTRRVLAIVVLTAATLLRAGPASAGGTGATDRVDVSDPHGDIVEHSARYTGLIFNVPVTVLTGADTSQSPSWQSPNTGIEIDVSIDGDGVPDAKATLAWDSGIRGVTSKTFYTDGRVCAGQGGGWNHANTYVVQIDPACWSYPPTIRYQIRMTWDVDGAPGGAATTDLAPDTGLTAAFGRGAATGGGYWLLGRDGGVFAFGEAGYYGSTGDVRLNQPVVAMSPTPSGQGYWFVAADGGMFAYGDAGFFGSTGDIKLNQPIVGMASTPTGNGYWLVARDGGIFAFGDAEFFGSTGDIRLNQPIVGMAPRPSGRGYWFTAADGGVFAFGSAGFYGSVPDSGKQATIVAMIPSRAGEGYMQISNTGYAFRFGDALSGNPADVATKGNAVGGTGTPYPFTSGYRAVTSDGSVYSVGGATDYGDLHGKKLTAPIVAIAATA